MLGGVASAWSRPPQTPERGQPLGWVVSFVARIWFLLNLVTSPLRIAAEAGIGTLVEVEASLERWLGALASRDPVR